MKHSSTEGYRPEGATGVTIVCREVCRHTGGVTTYICKKNADDRDIHLVSIRGRINPELQYYAILNRVANNAEELEDLLRFLRRRRLTETDVDRYDGVVRL